VGMTSACLLAVRDAFPTSTRRVSAHVGDDGLLDRVEVRGIGQWTRPSSGTSVAFFNAEATEASAPVRRSDGLSIRVQPGEPPDFP
jgi:hypothetical protein